MLNLCDDTVGVAAWTSDMVFIDGYIVKLWGGGKVGDDACE